MNKATFKEKLIKHITDKLDDGELDDDMSFSEFWSEVRDHVDDVADDEDIEDLDEDDEEEDEDDLVEIED